jgi:predicted metal-dependent HD superfamily phosphohydrolase
MKDRFQRLLDNFAKRDPASKYYSSLEISYSEPSRFYHNMGHIQHCLNELDQFCGNTNTYPEIEFALWYHDLVYDPTAKDNEEASARVASKVCDELGIPESFAKTVESLILITKHTQVPEQYSHKVIVDIDLSILGSDQAMYDLFEANIRREYSFVNEPDFIVGRSAILNGFLSRSHIFNTEHFLTKFENKARCNLVRTIQKYSEMANQPLRSPPDAARSGPPE